MSDSPRHLPSQTPGDFLNESLGRLSPKQVDALRVEAAKESLKLEVDRQRSIDRYRTADQEMTDFGDRARSVGLRKKQGVRESYEQTFKTASGEARMSVSSGGGPCFVATAVYGDADAPEVWALRRMRDAYLLTSGPGRAFVAWYYREGPRLASAVDGRPRLRRLCRYALSRLGRMAPP